MLLRQLWLATLCVLPIHALHSSEVGVVDWYRSHIGVPLVQSSSTAPLFHRTGEPDGPTQSVILSATTSNVLAALNPANGSVAWRHLFDTEEPIVAFQKHDNVVAALSGPGGATLRLLGVPTGHLILEKRLHSPEAGVLHEPASVGASIAFGDHVIYVLTNGYTLHAIDPSTSNSLWVWAPADQTSLVIFSDVVVTPSVVYLVGLSKSLASYTLHVTALSPTSGEVLIRADVPSSITDGPTGTIVVRHASQPDTTPHVVWLEQGSIRSVALTPELKTKPTTLKGAVYQKLHNIALSEYGQFVAIKEDGAGRVIKLAQDGSHLSAIWEFADSATSKKYTGSMYAGGLDKDGWPYVARVYWSHVLRKANAHIFAAHLAEGKGLVTGFTFPFDTSSNGIITHVAIDAVNPEALRVLARLVVTTTTGAVQLWQQDQLVWTREEGLSDIKVAEYIELPERKIIASRVGQGSESLSSRIRRQLGDAQDFPQYAVGFIKRFVTGSYASVSASVATNANTSEALARDAFGFRKIIVAATGYGRVYGIDSANGQIVWGRVFGLGWAAEVGGHIFPLKIFVTKTVNDGDEPQVVIVTQRKASNGLVDTVLFHINALTGEDARESALPGEVLEGHDAIAGPLVDAFLLRNGTSKYVVLLDEFLQTHIYPDTPENIAMYTNALPHVHFSLRTGTPGQRRLMGHQISTQKEFTGHFVAYPTWTASLPPNEDIQGLIIRPSEPVASLGKVLGNRTTLYKYLNPNLIGVLTASVAPAPPSCAIYLIDTVKGTILYHVVLPAAGGVCDVKATLTENWLVYHYYDDEVASADSTKGYRIVSVELYEGAKLDDKTKSSDMSSYSNQSIALTTYEQAYIFPRAITAISSTSTQFGISIKDIIVATETHQIQSFPRRALDPRRPKRKPTNEEMEEWLVQYDPLLPDDPKRILSHNYQVARTRRIITSPALLESTSLVFAYGLDLFSTRVAPSSTFDVLSENFNKVQLVLTVAGLAAAIMVTKPMVGRKRLREKWYN